MRISDCSSDLCSSDLNGEDVDVAKVQELVNGDIDDLHGVQITLAAIKLTTQLAAEYLRKARTEVWIEGGRFDSDDKAHPVLHRGDGIGMAAEMLEDLEHLPVEGGENGLD